MRPRRGGAMSSTLAIFSLIKGRRRRRCVASVAARPGRTDERAAEVGGRAAAEEVEIAEAETWRLHGPAICDSWFSSPVHSTVVCVCVTTYTEHACTQSGDGPWAVKIRLKHESTHNSGTSKFLIYCKLLASENSNLMFHSIKHIKYR